MILCKGCGTEIVYRRRGRPRHWCVECGAKQRAYYEANKGEIAAKKRAYREANKGEIAAKQRAYREANKGEIAAKQRAYYEANKGEIAAKQRAYYEANKGEIAAKKRAKEGRVCAECGEQMRVPSKSGFCGFCEAEQAEAA